MLGKPVAVRSAVTTLSVDRKPPLKAADSSSRARAGFLVATPTFELLYANAAALSILGFPHELDEPAVVERQLRSLFSQQRATPEAPAETAFVSGKRTYVCRPFLLDDPLNKTRQAMLGFLLERPFHRDELDVRRRFHLSPREFESVQYLTLGLTTKEVAEQMHVSPHTVKQYVRLVMSKMGVTTRAGIVGKLLSA